MPKRKPRKPRKPRRYEPELKPGTLEAIRELPHPIDLVKFYAIWRCGIIDGDLVSVLFPL